MRNSKGMNPLVSVGWIKQNGTRKGIGSFASGGAASLWRELLFGEARRTYEFLFSNSAVVNCNNWRYALVKAKQRVLS